MKPPAGTLVKPGHRATQGAIAIYPFNDGQGSILSDYAPSRDWSSNFHGAINNAAWVSSSHGGALEFTGDPDHVAIPDHDDFHFGSGDFAVGIEFTPTAGGENLRMLDHALNADGSGTSSIAIEWTSATNNIRCFLRIDAATTLGEISVNGIINLNQQYSLLYTRIGNTFSLYINGILIGTKVQAGTQLNAASPVNIGRNPSGILYFVGLIDSVYIRKEKGLSAIEASELAIDPFIAFKQSIDRSILFGPSVVAPPVDLDLFNPQIKNLKQSGLINSLKDKGQIESLKQQGKIKWVQ